MAVTSQVDQRAGRDAALAFAAVAALVTVLVRIDVTLPAIGHLGSALVALVFLYTPMFIAGRRGVDLVDYALRLAPLGRGLAFAGGSLAVIVPVFAVGFIGFYELACHSAALSH